MRILDKRFGHSALMERLRRLTEPCPAPLDLSDIEIIDWLDENCSIAQYAMPEEYINGGWWLDVDGITATKGTTLREAVCLAAEKLKRVAA